MYDVAPGVLQRLREADIIGRAGLAIASQGQEYCRSGAIHSTKRQGARLSGIVEPPLSSSKEGATATIATRALEHYSLDRCVVSVELRDMHTWNVDCTCDTVIIPPMICAHAAALLYQWLAHPFTFVPASNSTYATAMPFASAMPVELSAPTNEGQQSAQLIGTLNSSLALRASGSALHTEDFLSQMALAELRALAREYDIVANGAGKQELVDAIIEKLKQPEAIRRVVGTLEKQQRQFLATLTLAGGQMSDDDLRGLFERFSLGKPEKLQQILVALQGKALLLRSSVNMSLQPRSALHPSTLDVNWFIPSEVRAALHITLPTTTFDIEGQHASSAPSTIEYAEPFQLLADLLLVARALDGYRVERDDRRSKSNTGNLARIVNAHISDGSTALPAPAGHPPDSLLTWLQAAVPRSTTFLQFAYSVLRMADILYSENETAQGSTALLRMLPNAAELLLGSPHAEVLSELFTHWLQQSSYKELFDLQEEGLRLRCRATPLNQPALRSGELESENKAARQSLLTLLARAPTQQWIGFTAFARLIYRLNPTFLQRRQRTFTTPHWWIEQGEGMPLHPTQWSDWQQAEERYLARLLQGPLRWWGLSDIALTQNGRLQAFRLTPMAGLLLNGKPLETTHYTQSITPITIDAVEQDELLLQSSFENWPLIELIERFAQAHGVRNGRLSYRLTPASLSAALNRGESFDPLLELLNSAIASGAESDSTHSSLIRLLRQLEKRLDNYGRTRLYTDATVIEVAETLVLRELAATTSIEKHIVQRIRPTLVILSKQGGEQLVDELKKRGQTPLLHGEE